MENRLKKLLGIEVPIIQGGMAWISEANLASAVSNAGGAGIISTGGRTTEYTRDEIRRCRTLTDRPFGVNVMLMAPNRDEIVDLSSADRPLELPSQQDLDAMFDARGVVGEMYAGYEPRMEQKIMASEVLRAFSTSTNLVVEAGTGVGKSMAYLLPSELQSLQPKAHQC